MLKKIKMIDIFSGCGGLTDGFLQTGKFEEIAAVEWLKPQVDTLRHRLKTRWNKADSNETVMHFDIQNEKELFTGWKNHALFGNGKGLDYFVNKASGIDIIIGGPPCQAYSIAGRVRDENGMKGDYRNYLFEHYLSVVNNYRPKMFVFENVPGLLSAIPDGTPIPELMKDGFKRIGYEIINDLRKYTKVNANDYGVPQNRNRLVILGIDTLQYNNSQTLLELFYSKYLQDEKTTYKLTVRDAISDLEPCMPIYEMESHKLRISHQTPTSNISWQVPRYTNLRDMETFKMLAEDLESGRNIFNSKKISELYAEKIGSKSPIHRYHVLRPDEPSTTIIAHLYKDGNRFIHYDSQQARTITVREAARLQSFDDTFNFIGSRGSAYQMIGNAVPPQLAKRIGNAIYNFIDYCDNKNNKGRKENAPL